MQLPLLVHLLPATSPRHVFILNMGTAVHYIVSTDLCFLPFAHSTAENSLTVTIGDIDNKPQKINFNIVFVLLITIYHNLSQ